MKRISIFLLLGLWTPVFLNAQWEHLGTGFTTTQSGSGQLSIWSMGVVDSMQLWAMPVNPITPSSNGERLFARTLDGGGVWETGIVSNDTGYSNFGMYALNKDTAWWILMHLPHVDRAKVYRTNNGGFSWTEQTGPFNNPGQFIDQIHFFDDSVGVGYGSPNPGGISMPDSLRIYRTTDGGDNWMRIPSAQLPPLLGHEVIGTYTGNNNYDVKGDTLWFGTTTGRVWRTTDRGLTWTASATGFVGNAVSVQFQDHLNGLTVNSNGASGAKTTDGGLTWTGFPTLYPARFVEYIPGTAGHYFMSGVYWPQANYSMTTNSGTTWNAVNYSYPVYLNTIELLSPGLGFGGSWVDEPDSGGVYKWIGDLAAGNPDCTSCQQTVSEYPHVEGFEGNGGSWCQSSTDDINWTLNNGMTMTGNTGPTNASEGNYYAYLESDFPNTSGKEAHLISPCFALDSNCIGSAWFQFSAHMQGANMGVLQLYISTNGGSVWSPPVYTLSGSQGSNWITDSIDLSPFMGYDVRILINGATGAGNTSDLAIDNLKLTTSPKMQLGMVTDKNCYGDSTGQIDLIPSGGALPYSYSWSNGATTAALTNLTAGTYQVTVTDANACVLQEEVTLTDPPALTLTLNPDPVNCHGDTNGKINTQAGGGSGSLSYLWSNGGANPNLSNLAPGLYTVTLTDAHGCTLLDSAMVTEPDPLDPNFVITDVSCPGDSNGAVAFVPQGGTPPYSYIWFGGSDSLAEDLAPGSHSYTLADSKFCFTGGSFAIGEPDLVSAQFEVHDISCFGQNDGWLVVLPEGGNGGYSYLWSNGDTADSLSGLGVGTISVLLTDSLGCTGEGSTSINEPAELLVDLLKIDESAIGASDGSIDLTVMGGNPPYAFAWSTGDTTEDLSGLPGENSVHYSVTVTDANGCSKLDSAAILIGLEGGLPAMPLQVYPNPAKEELIVSFQTVSAGTAILEIYDLHGKQVFDKEMPYASGTSQLKLSVADLASGSYLLSVRTRKEAGYVRWVKI